MTPEQINEIECRVAALRRGIEPLAGRDLFGLSVMLCNSPPMPALC